MASAMVIKLNRPNSGSGNTAKRQSLPINVPPVVLQVCAKILGMVAMFSATAHCWFLRS